jgi:hypothetical protein
MERDNVFRLKYCIMKGNTKNKTQEEVTKKPLPLSTRNGVSKTPSHNLPPEQGDWRAYF